MRFCEENDFTTRGYDIMGDSDDQQMQRATLTRRFCPDMDKMKTFLKVKNGYSNWDRSSFSIEISVCNINHNSECESREKI